MKERMGPSLEDLAQKLKVPPGSTGIWLRALQKALGEDGQTKVVEYLVDKTTPKSEKH